MSCSERERSVAKALSPLVVVVLHIQQALMTWPQGLAGDVWVKNFSDPHWRLSMQNSKSQNLKVDSKGNGELTLSRSLTAAI